MLSGLLLIIRMKDAGGMFIERMLMIHYVKDKWMVEAIYHTPVTP
ncbi:hypothetical protein [Paenibacillus xylanivorans]|nr:hypothetical protein [Paenibacillus xylanivorans]